STRPEVPSGRPPPEAWSGRQVARSSGARSQRGPGQVDWKGRGQPEAASRGSPAGPTPSTRRCDTRAGRGGASCIPSSGTAAVSPPSVPVYQSEVRLPWRLRHELEDEITTLRQVLSAKERHLVEIKQKLGMNLMNELKQNFSRSWHDVQTTTAYKKTQETLSHAGQKATAAFSNVGTAISKKFGDMSYSIRHSISMPAMRNSPTFKSFEERVETTVTSLKVQTK
uniref:TPD52 like 1 n=1 Tax=Sus scrofa TaxID=9823 RepID=A0A8D0MGH7_PIG